MTNILGISAFYHDSAACLVRDGYIVAAAQEERFTRRKGDDAFPELAARFCLDEGGIAAHQLDAVAFYDKPVLHLDRLLESWLYTAPRGWRAFLKSGPLWAKSKLDLDGAIRRGLGAYDGKLLWCEHHESHAASAFYPSPFQRAALLTVDGVGEWATASMGRADGSTLELTHELRFPDSLGLLYSAFTYHAGFRVNSGEYKLMGLAPYGEPRFARAIYEHLIDLRDDGSFHMRQDCFDFVAGLRMTNERFSEHFGGAPRAPESPLAQREMDLARSVQDVTEEIVKRMARTAVRDADSRSLCMAGGVALNAVANGKLLREGIVDRLWVQPAAGDAGGALGAALLAWHRWFEQPREADDQHDSMRGALLGPKFGAEQVAQQLRAEGAVMHELGREGVIARSAGWLADGRIIAWFDGPMEFGPRALGARSILADARNPGMQSRLNRSIKFREGFRPFAPVVLAERAAEYFEIVGDSPYMLQVAPVREERRLAMPADATWGIDRLNMPRSDLPAITHLDYSARLQTVTADRTPGLRAVLEAFDARTSCPVLVNTSFNVRGEPIVCTPSDAYKCLMRTNIDALAIPPYFVIRAEQPDADSSRWQTPLPLD